MKRDLPIELYFNLKKDIEDLGLFKRMYLYYFLLFAFICSGFVLSVYFLSLSILQNGFTLVILNGVFLGFLTVQAGMLGHDLSHKQVFNNEKISILFSTIVWSLFVGLSQKYWFEKHNAHHKEVNHEDSDPDLDIIFSFDIGKPSRLHKNKLIKKYFIPYQHLLFFPLLPLMYFGFFKTSLKEAFLKFEIQRFFDIVLILTHFILVFYFIFSNLNFGYGLIFFLAYTFTTGFYMSLVFAPNHKGMEVISKDEKLEWYHQITGTRNLYPKKILFHMMGGLEYQIEHHLFTNMPRINYPKVAPIVKEFCKKHGITYYETSWIESMREIFASLKVEASRKI